MGGFLLLGSCSQPLFSSTHRIRQFSEILEEGIGAVSRPGGLAVIGPEVGGVDSVSFCSACSVFAL